jgi:protein involved in polysaccharide export with SLBB domain
MNCSLLSMRPAFSPVFMTPRMSTLSDFHNVATDAAHRRRGRAVRFALLLPVCFIAVASTPAFSGGQGTSGALISRDQLNAAATQAEQSQNGIEAAAIRQRLREGDFQTGDRILLTVFSDAAHTDTLVVRDGRIIDLPWKVALPLTGVLRSEVKDRVTAEVLKYVKADKVDVTPLTRIAILGEVARPGYFAIRSDIPITDAIMQAGGPTASADLERSVVRRASHEYRSADQTRQAVAKGLTIDQFGLNAGDELIVGRQHQLFNPASSAVLGMIASLSAIFFAVHH